MNRLKKYYKEEYTRIAVYVVITALILFISCLIVLWASGECGRILTFISAVLKPLVLGIVLAYLLSPVVTKLEKKLSGNIDRKIARRGMAVLIVYGVIFAFIAAILALIAITVTEGIATIDFADIKGHLIILSREFTKFESEIRAALSKLDINIGGAGVLLIRFINTLKSGASVLLFAVIFSIYFLLDSGIWKYWVKVIKIFASDEKIEKLRQLVADADKVFSGYIRGQSIDAFLVGSMVSIALLIAGIPYAIVIGILTGLGNLIPYVGPVVGFGSLLVVCIADGSLKHLAVGAVILILVMAIDGNVINPKILGSKVEVHPVLVIVALLAGGEIGGIVGMLVAVPVAALIKMQFDKYMRRKAAVQQTAAQQIEDSNS